MSCISLLTQGFTLDCADQLGGISRVLLTNTENVTAFVEATGTVSAITMASTTQFFEYELEEEDADFITTEQKSKENGTLFYETVFNFTIDKMSATKSEELKLMAAARNLVLIAQLNNGDFVSLGLDKVNGLAGGAKKIGGTNQAASGKAFGDKAGYTVGITAMETHYPYYVDSGIIDALLSPAA